MSISMYFGLLVAIYGSSFLPRWWRCASFVASAVFALIAIIGEQFGGAR